MIFAILIGRAGSRGLPGKNTSKILGRRLCEYPLIAASKSKYIEKIFVSTDCSKIKKVSKKYNVDFVVRPKRLSNSKALGDHVFEYTYKDVKMDFLLPFLVILEGKSNGLNCFQVTHFC